MLDRYLNTPLKFSVAERQNDRYLKNSDSTSIARAIKYTSLHIQTDTWRQIYKYTSWNFCKSCSLFQKLPEVFYKKTVLKNVAIFVGNHVLSFFFNKAGGLRPATLFKMWLQHRYFHMNIAKFLRTPILKNICQQLLLLFMIQATFDRFQIESSLKTLQLSGFKNSCPWIFGNYEEMHLLWIF